MRLSLTRMLFLILTVGFLPSISVNTTLEAKEKKPTTAAKPEAPEWAEITITGSYPEATPMPGLFEEQVESLSTLLSRLKFAQRDLRLTGLVLKIKSPQIGFGKLNELRAAIKRVRAEGKKVYATLDSATLKDYLLASACDEIIMPESGSFMLLGLRMEISFYKNLFDKLEIQPDVLKVGKYKSAAEPYSRTEMSEPFREEMESILDSYYDQIITTIATDRNISKEVVIKAIDEGPHTIAQAQALGLIDHVEYQDQLLSRIKNNDSRVKLKTRYGKKKMDTDFSGFGGMMKMMNLLMGIEPKKRPSKNPKIAIIYATGPIMTGKSQSGLLGSTMGSETIIKAIQTAKNDDTVKAVLLRVDSPGGSALASDLMWRELENLNKPVVASMSDVAASGGYYISMGADHIFAEPGTITGSIGVVGGKVALKGLMEKIGVTTTVISRGKNSGVMSPLTPFSDSERVSMQKMMNDIYAQFTSKAAAGRKMPLEKLVALAGGRVYTGEQALENGLVDSLGTLHDALEKTKELAALTKKDRVELIELPRTPSPFEQLFGGMDESTQMKLLGDLIQQQSPEIVNLLKQSWMMNLLSQETFLTIQPFQFSVK